MKIRTRLIIGFLIVAGAAFYYLTDWIIKELRPNYLKAMEESLVDTATLLASLLSSDKDTIDYTSLKEAFPKALERTFKAKIHDVIKERMNIRTYVTDGTGRVIFDSKQKDTGKDFSRWNDVRFTLKGEYGARSTRSDPENPNSSVLYVASPILLKGKIAGVLTVCKPADSVALFINNARKKILLTGILAGLAVLLFASLLSIWVTVPIHRITAFTRTLRDRKSSKVPNLHPLGILGRNEMDELVTALVEMRDALENKKYVENYVQTLTHELKSPLSAIRGAAELIDDQMPPDERSRFLENINSETLRIQSMIERLLELSNLENRAGLKGTESIDIVHLINDIANSFEPVCRKKRITLTLPEIKGITITAEKFLLRQSIVNIIQNAIDFSPSGESISILLSKEQHCAVITIDDNGPGIPDYALNRIFERFYSLPRPESNLKSTGLGLSFVKEAVSLHGGSVEIINRSDGGTRVSVEWPYIPS